MAEAEAVQIDPARQMLIPVTKGKANLVIDVEALPPEVFQEAVYQGLKVLLNKNMSKITVAKLEGEALEAAKDAAMVQAEKNLKDMNEGTIRLSGKPKAKKASGAVMTEARRLARNLVKDEMKREGIKVSHVEAKEITRAANEVLADADMGAKLMAQAEANLKAREEEAAQSGALKSVTKSIKTSPKLVAKAEADKASKRKDTSATQSGKVQVRAKPKAGREGAAAH